MYIDGAAEGNPGDAGIGIIIIEQEKEILHISEYIGFTTNNVAEYFALIRGMIESLLLGIKKIKIFSDSELLVKQMKGSYKIKTSHLFPLFYLAKNLSKKFENMQIEYIHRERNIKADKLASLAIKNYKLRRREKWRN